jgi:hypothetical protein
MAEEAKKNIAIAAPQTVTTATEMKTTAQDPNQFRTAFEQRQQASQGNIQNAFDNSLNTQTQELGQGLQQNLAAQDAQTAASQGQYAFAREDLGTQAARTGAGMDRYADVRGLNRQAGSQQSLMLGRGAATAAGRLAAQQQAAEAESARQKALLTNDYNGRVQAALANRDYSQAAALLDDYNNQHAWLDKNAEAMAAFGNFTGYEYLYGPGQARTMQQFWIGTNPELAYNTGVIDAKRYKEITGRNAPDVKNSGAGGNIDNHTPSAHEIWVGRGGGGGGNTSGGG